MEKQYKAKVTIAINNEQTINNMALEKEAFQIECATANKKLNNHKDARNKAINDFKKAIKEALYE